MRREREHQRRRRPGRVGADGGIDIRVLVELVDQFEDRGDRGMEGEAPIKIARDLVNRPVCLAHQGEGVALQRFSAGAGQQASPSSIQL